MRELKGLPVYLLLGWAYVAAIIYLSLTSSPPDGPEIPNIDKLLHFLAYFGMGFWFGMLTKRTYMYLYQLALFALLGVFLEWLQERGGIRQAEGLDALANAAGIIAAGLLWPLTRNWLAKAELRLGWR